MAILAVETVQGHQSLEALQSGLTNPNEQAAGVGHTCLTCSFNCCQSCTGLLHSMMTYLSSACCLRWRLDICQNLGFIGILLSCTHSAQPIICLLIWKPSSSVLRHLQAGSAANALCLPDIGACKRQPELLLNRAVESEASQENKCL